MKNDTFKVCVRILLYKERMFSSSKGILRDNFYFLTALKKRQESVGCKSEPSKDETVESDPEGPDVGRSARVRRLAGLLRLVGGERWFKCGLQYKKMVGMWTPIVEEVGWKKIISELTNDSGAVKAGVPAQSVLENSYSTFI